MVAPGATGASFDVLLRFSLDPAANERVSKGVTTIDQELKRIEQDALKAGKAVSTAFSNIDTKSQTVQKSVVKLGVELAKLGERTQAGAKQTNQALDTNIRKLKEVEEAANRTRQQAGLISGAAARGAAIFGQGLLAGVGVTGGIFAEANRFAREVQDTAKATQATREWTAATRELAQARSRVDTVLLREALPLLQQAARLANEAADFIERNPEIVQAALKTGLVVAELSAIGLAVTKGIKLVADTAYIAAVATELLAAKLHERAADKELAAASKGLITNRADDLRRAFGQTPTPASNLSLVSAAALIVAGVIASGAVVSWVNQILEKTGVGDDIRMARDQARANNARIYPGLINNPAERQLQVQLNKAISAGDTREIERLKNEIKNLGDQASETANDLQRTSLSVADSPQFDNLIKAYEDYRADDLALVQQHYQDRQGIIEDALSAELAENKRYADSVAKVNANTSKSLANAANDFAEANTRAEQQYQEQRAQIIRDGNDEIERIQAESKDRLRKLEQEHEDRVAGLISSRDALGLARENRSFRQDVSDEKRQTAQEVRDRKQAIAQRLADLQQSYEQERAQRLVDYQARVAEIRANAAEQLKELAAQHQADLQQIQAQKVAKLREIDDQFTQERKRRYQYFIQQIKDLDATLLGESKLRQAYQTKMLTDLDAFLAAYRAKLGSLSSVTPTTTNTTGRAYGGYASYGMYRLGDDPSGGRGPDEYVIKGVTTQALERAVGGKLNDQILLAALRGYTGGSGTYIDQRRIDQPVSKWDKKMMEDAAMEALKKVIGKR